MTGGRAVGWVWVWACGWVVVYQDGAMEQQLLQPMLFWATTSVDDPNEVRSGAGSYIAAVQEVLTGAQASIDLIYDGETAHEVSQMRMFNTRGGGWSGPAHPRLSLVSLRPLLPTCFVTLSCISFSCFVFSSCITTYCVTHWPCASGTDAFSLPSLCGFMPPFLPRPLSLL